MKNPKAKTAPSVTRFPKVKSWPDGKKRRIRVPRITLRRLSAKLRVLNRAAKESDERAVRRGLTNYVNAARIELIELRKYVDITLNRDFKTI